MSDTEVVYTKRGCEAGVRRDGRDVKDFRDLQIENNILPHVNGSSYVRLGLGMEVMCSIKLDVAEPMPNFPDRGMVTFSLDFSPSCGLKIDDRRRAELSRQIGERLQCVLLGSSSIDLNSLCIIHGKYCWLVHIDFIVFQLDGDPLDMCSIACHIALKSTKIPKVDLILGGSGFAEDFQVCGDAAAALPLKTRDVPICVTVVKIGATVVMDANSLELASSDYAFVVAVDRQGCLCGFFKLHGQGSLSVPDMTSIFEVSDYWNLPEISMQYFLIILSI